MRYGHRLNELLKDKLEIRLEVKRDHKLSWSGDIFKIDVALLYDNELISSDTEIIDLNTKRLDADYN